MKTYLSIFFLIAAALTVSAAPSDVTAQLEPGRITLDQTAQLTITASSGGDDTLSPPTVSGLEFVSVGQSSQIQIVNGAMTSTTSATYEVIPQRAGTFIIPPLGAGNQPLVLYVQPGNNGSSGNNLPPPATSGSASASEPRLTQDGAAFVRLVLPRHKLYVGESVPVDIQVGYHPGMVASLDGLPTLGGGSFTLNKLSAQPEQSEAVVDGKPFTVLTWHSVLAGVEPGDFSLTVDTPLTVRIRTAPRRLPQMPGFDDSMLDEAFNDPFFQSFFGGTTEKEITLTSDAQPLKVLPLPTEGRPAGFSGAIGQFQASSELSATQAAAGDPLTLRLKISGTGNFDRVNSTMFSKVDGWKTYPATAKFEPGDSAGYSGEKNFEQAVIPMQPGKEALPALAFSFFNPDTRRYETKMTTPLSVEVSPAPGGGLAATAATPEPPQDGLRGDHAVSGGTVATLRPLYFQPWFVGIQGSLVLSFAAGLLFLRRREHPPADDKLDAVKGCLAEMDAASVAGDAARFFQSARVALQQRLGALWHVAPASITIADIDVRLNGQGKEIRRVFALADQAAYSGQHLSASDFTQWKEIVRNELKHTEAL
jgi:hypothetical protein